MPGTRPYRAAPSPRPLKPSYELHARRWLRMRASRVRASTNQVRRYMRPLARCGFQGTREPTLGCYTQRIRNLPYRATWKFNMKMVKSLILGSAAGLVAMSGAQAADLPVKAKAVEYVRICSLYGAGFFYIPGTDT